MDSICCRTTSCWRLTWTCWCESVLMLSYMFASGTHIQSEASGRPLLSDPLWALFSLLLPRKHQDIRSPAPCLIKADAANNHKAIMGVIKSLYPGALICAEPDRGAEMLWGSSGFPMQRGCYGVIPKLYPHNMGGLWYHCNTKEHRSSVHTSDSVQHDELPKHLNNSKTNNKTAATDSLKKSASDVKTWKSLLKQQWM